MKDSWEIIRGLFYSTSTNDLKAAYAMNARRPKNFNLTAQLKYQTG